MPSILVWGALAVGSVGVVVFYRRIEMMINNNILRGVFDGWC